MGAYLSEPMTQKQSEDGEGNKLKFGACSMQGWRISQEDAHNCAASFDKDSSLFAVYDGHGGAEVAIYLSRHLPDMLKACVAYKDGEFVKALEECYLKVDASIKTPEVLKEIQQIAKKSDNYDENTDAAVDYEKENVAKLYEEAAMPLDELVAKYQSGTSGESEGTEEDVDPNCKPGSSKSITAGGSPSSSVAGSSSKPQATAGRSSGLAGGSSSTSAGSSSSSGESVSNSNGTEASVKVNGESSTTEKLAGSLLENKTETINELVVEGKKIKLEIPKTEELAGAAQNSKQSAKKEEAGKSSKPAEEPASPTTTEEINGKKEKASENGTKSEKPSAENSSETKPTVNGGGDGANSTTNGETAAATTAVQSTPEVTPRRKKVHPIPTVIPEEAKQEKRRSPRKSNQSPSASFDCSESDESDEDDAGYNVGDGDSEDDSTLDDEEDLGEDSDDDDDDDEEEYEAEEEDERFLNEMQEPGYDSGATAVVCFMKWEADGLSLYVANAGDSRCVVCREGKAIDMSHDHKPELEEEAQRIVKAGGKVTDDGRVNGGLNLSRALGDHSYKTNEALPPQEQMISPLPSVEHILLNPQKDKFLVLACDGIWNSMSSQEVVDFVGKRLAEKESLSKICEDLFDNCLAPDTHGDGTGCDNMTCIIVKLSDAPEVYSGSKRKLSTEETATTEESESLKKSRVE